MSVTSPNPLFSDFWARPADELNPDIEASDKPELLPSSFIHGIKHLPVQFTPTSR